MDAQSRLNGPKIVGRSVRPPRIAYILGDLSQCEAFINVCSLTWGGRYFLAVPYNSASIDDEWWHVLQSYDPDKVVTCVDLDDATDKRLASLGKARVDRDVAQGQKHVTRCNLQLPNEAIYGQSVFSLFAALHTIEKREQYLPALVVGVDEHDPLKLYIKARYGSYDANFAKATLAREDLRLDLSLSSFLPIKDVSLGNNFIEYVSHNELSFDKRERQALPLIEYTLADLTQEVGERSMEEYGKPEIVYDMQQIIIISDKPSLQDFCWYWALRGQRLFTIETRLPIWMPMEVAHQKISKLRDLRQAGKRGYVISKSVPIAELTKLVSELDDKIEIRTDNLDHFYSEKYVLGVMDRLEVIFDNGSARIPVHDIDEVKLCSHPRYYFTDVELPDYKLPRFHGTDWVERLLVSCRVTRTGLSFFTWNHRSEPYYHLTVPTAWQVVQTYADIAGYSTELSDKGRLAQQVVHLVGGPEYLWMLSGRTVYQLIDSLSELSQAKEFKARLREIQTVHISDAEETDTFTEQVMRFMAADRHERVYQSYSKIQDSLKLKTNKLTERFMKWLLDHRILFRGTTINCPKCNLAQWLFLDDIKSQMTCPGCQQLFDVPLGINTTAWQYRINTLFAKAHEQGVTPHLLALSYYVDGVGRDRWTSNLLDFFPGIKLHAQRADLPIQEMELDLAWIEDGQLSIGECKTNGWELKADEVLRYFKIAGLLKCNRIVFCTTGDFSTLDASIIDNFKNPPCKVVLLEGKDLFNQYPNRKTLTEDMPERYQISDESFETYMKASFDAHAYD
jgi:hypothetical protein